MALETAPGVAPAQVGPPWRDTSLAGCREVAEGRGERRWWAAPPVTGCAAGLVGLLVVMCLSAAWPGRHGVSRAGYLVAPLAPWAACLGGLAQADRHRLAVPATLLRAGAAMTVVATVASAWSGGHWQAVVQGSLAAVAVCGVLSGLALARPHGLGGGDVKVATLAAFGAGRAGAALAVTVLVCVPAGVAIWQLSSRGRRAGRAHPVALCPWLALAGLGGLVAGAL